MAKLVRQDAPTVHLQAEPLVHENPVDRGVVAGIGAVEQLVVVGEVEPDMNEGPEVPPW